jgi:sulfatase maturation enzyme AslB (radical SAM superfamily)
MEDSDWLKDIKKKMRDDQWPDECVRCQQSEKTKGESIRTNSIDRHRLLKATRKDYLIVGGVLDNICNSACQSCNAGLSTKIGSLSSTQYPRVDNYELFKAFPQERIVELDVNGGEPTASKNYKRILNDLPSNIKIVRMNTNGSRMIEEIEQILQKGIMVIVTMSLDGIGKVHDYARWPIKWSDYQNTVYAYKGLQAKHRLLHLDFWTTVSCLNIADLQNIQRFARDNQTPHDWAFLKKPDVLNVEHKNRFTDSAKSLYPQDVAIGSNNEEELDEFIARQDRLRGIDVRDYFNFFPK